IKSLQTPPPPGIPLARQGLFYVIEHCICSKKKKPRLCGMQRRGESSGGGRMRRRAQDGYLPADWKAFMAWSALMAAGVKLLFFHQAATLAATVRPVVTRGSTWASSMGRTAWPVALRI